MSGGGGGGMLGRAVEQAQAQGQSSGSSHAAYGSGTQGVSPPSTYYSPYYGNAGSFENGMIGGQYSRGGGNVADVPGMNYVSPPQTEAPAYIPSFAFNPSGLQAAYQNMFDQFSRQYSGPQLASDLTATTANKVPTYQTAAMTQANKRRDEIPTNVHSVAPSVAFQQLQQQLAELQAYKAQQEAAQQSNQYGGNGTLQGGSWGGGGE
jgi:hypothetical protein